MARVQHNRIKTHAFPAAKGAASAGNALTRGTRESSSKRSRHLLAALAAILTLVAVIWFADDLVLLAEEVLQLPGGQWWLWSLKTMAVMATANLVWRIWLAATYKSVAPLADQDLPLVTVVVPAFNEGRQVMDTLISVAASDYPAHKLQIISVDDGSRDDTWLWMKRAQRRLGKRVELIRQPVNGGKRRALYTAFGRARGEMLVTIDSDSLVRPDTLRHLISPLAADPRVGAVAGNVRVLNLKEGFIARLMEVSFTYSFDFVRAGQSRVNTVFCTPGALSAYRRSVVEPHLDHWLTQTFMGRPAGIGEDRAMTNLILRDGYLVHFARRAEVFTKVPVTFKPLSRMLLRWARSNIRETLVMCTFAFRRFRPESALAARLMLVMSILQMTFGEVAKLAALTALVLGPLTLGLNMVTGALLTAVVPAVVYALRHRSWLGLWAFAYTLYYMTFLWWVSLYALLTPQNSSWLTRGVGIQAVAQPLVEKLEPQPLAPLQSM